MSYQINKTDGTILTELVDGQVDKNSTNLVLVGKNYTGFGEFLNENFVKLLENFSNSAAPSNPITGQTWWDTSERKLKVYNGESWKATSIPYAESSTIVKGEGDLWVDSVKNQLIMYNGTAEVVIGPIYTKTEGTSGFEVATIQDVQGANIVLKLWIANSLVGILSNATFTPLSTNRVTELVSLSNPNGIIYKGFNAVAGFEFVGTASSSKGLVDAAGNIKSAANFLASDTASTTTGTISIKNNGGLRIGPNTNNIQKITGNRFEIENQLVDQDISIRVKSSLSSALTIDAIYIDTSTKYIGIFKNDPAYTLDVNGTQRISGNLTVEGNLIVNGSSVQVAVETLLVEGKTLELASTNGVAFGDNSYIDGGGLILKSSATDKSLIWIQAENAWTSNTNLDLSNILSTYKINGVDKLTYNGLVNVTKALDLNEIGTLIGLTVDNISLDGNVINSTSSLNLVAQVSNITLNPVTTIDVLNNKRITGLGAPVDSQDATNKTYVDQTISTSPTFFSLDVTGLGTGNTLRSNVASILNNLSPAGASNINKLVKILTVSYQDTTVSNINVDAIKSVTYTYVDANGTLNKSVVENVSFPNTATGILSLTPVRTYMLYTSNGTAWIHVSTTAYA